MLFLTRFYLFDQLGWLRCIMLDNHTPVKLLLLANLLASYLGESLKATCTQRMASPKCHPMAQPTIFTIASQKTLFIRRGSQVWLCCE